MELSEVIEFCNKVMTEGLEACENERGKLTVTRAGFRNFQRDRKIISKNPTLVEALNRLNRFGLELEQAQRAFHNMREIVRELVTCDPRNIEEIEKLQEKACLCLQANKLTQTKIVSVTPVSNK